MPWGASNTQEHRCTYRFDVFNFTICKNYTNYSSLALVCIGTLHKIKHKHSLVYVVLMSALYAVLFVFLGEPVIFFYIIFKDSK